MDLWWLHLDGEEVEAGFTGDGAPQQRLGAARRPVQQHPACTQSKDP